MGTRKTSVAIDEELLERARAILDTDTIRETIRCALLEVIREEARREELRALSNMEGLKLDDEEVMREAWGYVGVMKQLKAEAARRERLRCTLAPPRNQSWWSDAMTRRRARRVRHAIADLDLESGRFADTFMKGIDFGSSRTLRSRRHEPTRPGHK